MVPQVGVTPDGITTVAMSFLLGSGGAGVVVWSLNRWGANIDARRSEQKEVGREAIEEHRSIRSDIMAWAAILRSDNDRLRDRVDALEKEKVTMFDKLEKAMHDSEDCHRRLEWLEHEAQNYRSEVAHLKDQLRNSGFQLDSDRNGF
jgi:predicted nuclease with TOPRIM domain